MPWPDDPRVLFAAERTLLAWNRTSVTLMALGFVIERSALLLAHLDAAHGPPATDTAFWTGASFILLAVVSALSAAHRFHRLVATLPPETIPAGYQPRRGAALTVVVALLGLLLLGYLALDTF